MKKVNLDLIKNLIISLLIVFCIILIISVIFYDDISIGKIVPESEEYMLTDEMEEDLNKTVKEDTTEIITTYYIDAADLKKYEKTKEYNKGKKNPFAVESENAADDNAVTSNSSTNIEDNTASSNLTNFYEDKGIK